MATSNNVSVKSIVNNMKTKYGNQSINNSNRNGSNNGSNSNSDSGVINNLVIGIKNKLNSN